MNKLPNITSLRFFLALFVLIFHLAEFCKKHAIPYYDGLALFHKGTEAVYVFFSLSGFLIIRQLYLEKVETGTIALKKFLSRRALRIFPLYLVILTFGLFYYRLLLPELGFETVTDYNVYEGIALSLFFMPNVFAFLYQPGGIIGILWSIGIEEQFYLLIAPTLFFLPKKRILSFLLLFTIIYFAAFSIDYFFILRRFGMYFFYFSAAGIVSILMTKNRLLFQNTIIRNGLLLLSILYFTTTIFVENLSFQGYHLVSMVLFSMTIGYLATTPLPILNRKPLIYLGKISYGIYMFHAIVIQGVGFMYLELFPQQAIPSFVVVLSYNFAVVLLTVFISHLSYKYYESYFIRLKKFQ